MAESIKALSLSPQPRRRLRHGIAEPSNVSFTKMTEATVALALQSIRTPVLRRRRDSRRSSPSFIIPPVRWALVSMPSTSSKAYSAPWIFTLSTLRIVGNLSDLKLSEQIGRYVWGVCCRSRTCSHRRSASWKNRWRLGRICSSVGQVIYHRSGFSCHRRHSDCS